MRVGMRVRVGGEILWGRLGGIGLGLEAYEQSVKERQDEGKAARLNRGP